MSRKVLSGKKPHKDGCRNATLIAAIMLVFPIACAPNYELRVDSLGHPTIFNVKSGRPRVARAYKATGGYKVITLYTTGSNGRSRKITKRFCDIVCRSVHGPPPHNHTCDHIDKNNSNDNVNNVRWATASEQRANQKKLEGPNARQESLKAEDADGIVRDYANILTAGYDIARNGESIRSVMNQIRDAASGRRPDNMFRGLVWAWVRPLGDDVVEWRAIPREATRGCATGHMVSRCGLIKEKHGRITAGYLHPNGYMMFCGCRVHRMVAMAWCPGRTAERNVVDHWDRNPRNNHADNLRWVTKAENSENAIYGNEIRVRQVCPSERRTLATHTSIAAASNHLSQTSNTPVYDYNIMRAVHGHQDTAYGFIWIATDPAIESAAALVRAARRERPGKRQPVWQKRADTGIRMTRFESIAAAHIAVPGAGHIADCCNGRRKTSGGFGWEYDAPDPDRTPKTSTSTAAKRYQLTDAAGQVLARMVSGTQASKELRERWGVDVSQSTISRKLKMVDQAIELAIEGRGACTLRLASD